MLFFVGVDFPSNLESNENSYKQLHNEHYIIWCDAIAEGLGFSQQVSLGNINLVQVTWA